MIIMRKLELGMPTLAELPAVDACAALCQSLGFQFVELNMNLPEYQPGRLDERMLAATREQSGVYFTLHLDENLNVCDFNPYVADAYVRTALEAIALAKRHGIPIINMHLNEGVHFKLPDQRLYLFEQYRDVYLEKLGLFRRLCEDAIGGSSVRICVENTDGWRSFAQRGIDLLLESEVFGLTLDVGHSYCASGADETFILARADRLAHMHLHDANDITCHLPLGSGVLDLPAKVALAEQTGCRAVVEVKTVQGLWQAKEWLDDYL